jgi:hypothetical protein
LFSHRLLQQQHPATAQLVTNMNNTKSQFFTKLPMTMISINILYMQWMYFHTQAMQKREDNQQSTK